MNAIVSYIAEHNGKIAWIEAVANINFAFLNPLSTPINL